jgi:hypothetical protein
MPGLFSHFLNDKHLPVSSFMFFMLFLPQWIMLSFLCVFKKKTEWELKKWGSQGKLFFFYKYEILHLYCK